MTVINFAYIHSLHPLFHSNAHCAPAQGQARAYCPEVSSCPLEALSDGERGFQQ